MIVLNYNEWKDITRLDNFYSEEKQREIYENSYLPMKQEQRKHIKETGGFPNCWCNHCIDGMEEFKGFKKYDEFYYKGEKVYIRSFNPSTSGFDIFVSGKGNGFCEWLKADTANDVLVKELELIS